MSNEGTIIASLTQTYQEFAKSGYLIWCFVATGKSARGNGSSANEPGRQNGLPYGSRDVSLFFADNETVILRELDEVYDVMDIELLFERGKMFID